MARNDLLAGMASADLFEHFPGALLIVDADGIIVRANRECALLVSQQEDRITKRPLDDVLTLMRHDNGDVFAEAWSSPGAIKDEPGEWRGARKSVTVTVSAHKITTGDTPFLFVSLRNATREQAVIKALRDVAARAATTADNLAAMGEGSVQKVEEIRNSMQEIADGTQVQATKVEETVDVIKDLAMSIDSINDHAQQASAKAQQQAVTARQGTAVASQALDSIKTIIRGVESTRDVVNELATHVEEIEKILDFVREISQQSNMLALNASIEAARAGEHGRAFAVVADEVKRLSEHTRTSITKVGGIINEVKLETDGAIRAIEARTSEVQGSASFIQDALGRFDQMAADILESSEILESISSATVEQKKGAGAIVGAIDEVAAVAEETSTSTENTFGLAEEMAESMDALNTAAHELTSIANSLHSTLDRYFHYGSERVADDTLDVTEPNDNRSSRGNRTRTSGTSRTPRTGRTDRPGRTTRS